MLLVVFCCKPVQSDEIIDSRENENPVEDIILPTSVPDEITIVTFIDSDGKETKAVSYPGLVVVRTVDNVPVKDVRNLASDLGGTIVCQIPDIGYYVVSVTPGKEAEFIASARERQNLFLLPKERPRK